MKLIARSIVLLYLTMLYIVNSGYWPNGKVLYMFCKQFYESKTENGIEILTCERCNQIREAMDTIEKETCVEFVEVDNSTPREQTVMFLTDPVRCASFVGYNEEIRYKFSVLGPNCFYPDTLIHELVHILGFGHMHNQANRDEYIQIHSENIQKDKLSQYEKVDSVISEFCPYDHHSIMHYREKDFSKNNIDLTITTQNKEKLGSSSLSECDILNIHVAYQCDGTDEMLNKLKPQCTEVETPHFVVKVLKRG